MSVWMLTGLLMYKGCDGLESMGQGWENVKTNAGIRVPVNDNLNCALMQVK